MGQKVNPIGLRTALTKNWESRWFADKKSGGKTLFGEWLQEDLAIRKFIKEKFAQAAIARIQIERFANRVRVTICSARPGLLIGKKGAELESMKAQVAKLTAGKEVFIEIAEVRRADTNAQLVSENIAQQLERRIGFRRAMKRDGYGRGRDQDQLRRASRRSGTGSRRTVQGRPCAASYAEGEHRLRLHRSEYDGRNDRRQGLDLSQRLYGGTRLCR